MGATVVGAGVTGVLLSIVTTLLTLLGVAPAGLTSLALGGAIGAAAAGTAWLYLYGSRPGLAITAAAVGAFAAATQHFWAYLVFVQRWRQSRIQDPQVAIFRDEQPPLDFLRFLQNDASPVNVAWWTLDILLAAIAAGFVAWLVRKRWAYCAECLGWYSLRWRGQLGSADAPPQVRNLTGFPADAAATLFSCTQQCGPWRVELRWKEEGKECVDRRWIECVEGNDQ